MNYNLILSALLVAATCCSLVLVHLSWKRRELPIAVSYGVGMLAGAFYTFGYAFEIASTTLEHIRFWLRVEYIGIPFGATIWIIMVLQYTGRQALIRVRMVIILLLVPLMTLVAQYTNEWHHLFYRSISIDHSEGFPLVQLERGPLYAVHLGYSYLFFVIGMGLMIQMYRKSAPRAKKQVAFMMIGSLGPFGFPLIYLSGIIDVPFDLSPFGFIFSGIFYMWGIYQFNMLKLAPMALQKVFESMQDAVIVFDLDNTVTSYNQSASRLIAGLSEKKAIGHPAAEPFSEYPMLLEMIKQEPVSKSKVQLSWGNRTYQVHMTIIQNQRLRPVGKMLMMSDITETVRYEERLLDKSKQLSELNTFKDKMFNVVAHDIRDPLAVLINLMELMEEEMHACGGSHDEIVQEMGLQIQNTFTLVESLLEWFQSQRGGMVFNPVTRDLAHVVRMNMRFMQVRSGAKNIHIQSDIPDNLYVFADKEMLDLIIRNLLSNAIKFTGQGGYIRLQADQYEDRVVVSVSDTGSGIPTAQAESLLQEAYPDSSLGTAGERGVGLGLTLCREFVRLNGGEIWFDSKLDKGTTFYFSIPIPSMASTTSSMNQIGRRGIV